MSRLHSLPEVIALADLPSAFYMAHDLALMWRKRPASIRWWLLFLRRAGQGPAPDQVERKRIAGHPYVAYRADYVQALEAAFMSQTRPSPRNVKSNKQFYLDTGRLSGVKSPRA